MSPVTDYCFHVSWCVYVCGIIFLFHTYITGLPLSTLSLSICVSLSVTGASRRRNKELDVQQGAWARVGEITLLLEKNA